MSTILWSRRFRLRFTRIALLLSAATAAHAWVTSVEFPFAALPRPVWERELAHLKEMGVTHVSLPSSTADAAQLDDVIRILRRLGLEADLEGPLPDRLQTNAKSHGGPLTEPLTGALRISALMPRALENERKLLTGGTQAIVWTDAFETLRPVHQAGAILLAGGEGPGAALIRRDAQLARYWGRTLSELPESPGARLVVPADGISVHQYIADKNGTAPPGLSLVSVVNDSPNAWKGDVRILYPALQRPIAIPNVAVAAHDVVWLPVNIPLTGGTLCSGCTGFAPPDHVAYATAELTAMEYENGILAMEFIAPSAGEVVLQLSHEPSGPLVAAGKPSIFDWDPKTQRARLPIPAGPGATGRVRVALALDAPSATAFFETAPVLLIGETNRLSAQFSPAGVAARSRLRAPIELTVTQDISLPAKDKPDQPAIVTYKVGVPASVLAGDVSQLAIEADGAQLSHAQFRFLAPVAVAFTEAVAVRVGSGSFVPLTPATIPVNQRSGREIVVSIRNNAPEIRTFNIVADVPGLAFSPESLTVSVGASVARDVTFRVFSATAAPGIHAGEVRISGVANLTEPVRFVVLPPTGAVAWSADGFEILESSKLRASFMPGRWLEMINKDSGADSQPAGGTPFNGGPVERLMLDDLEKSAGQAKGAGASQPLLPR